MVMGWFKGGHDWRAIYEPVARQAARAAGMPEDVFVRLIERESGWDPSSVSSAGAVGIAQLMPVHWKENDPAGANPKDPVDSLYYAARLFASHERNFGGWDKAAAAYVAGPGNLQNAIATGGADWHTALMNILGPADAAQVAPYIAYISGKSPGGQTPSWITPPKTGEAGGGQQALNVGWPNPREFQTPSGETGSRVDWESYSGAIWQIVSPYALSGTPLPDDAPPMAQMMYDSIVAEQQPDAGAEQRADLASWIDATVKTLGVEIDARRLTMEQAAGEFDRRLKAMQLGTQMFSAMAPYAIPPGKEYLPGYEPGGLASRVGLEPVKAQGQEVSPYQWAENIVGATPNLTEIGVPETGNLFQQALAMIQQGSAGAGGATVPGGGALPTGGPSPARPGDLFGTNTMPWPSGLRGSSDLFGTDTMPWPAQVPQVPWSGPPYGGIDPLTGKPQGRFSGTTLPTGVAQRDPATGRPLSPAPAGPSPSPWIFPPQAPTGPQQPTTFYDYLMQWIAQQRG